MFNIFGGLAVAAVAYGFYVYKHYEHRTSSLKEYNRHTEILTKTIIENADKDIDIITNALLKVCASQDETNRFLLTKMDTVIRPKIPRSWLTDIRVGKYNFDVRLWNRLYQSGN